MADALRTLLSRVDGSADSIQRAAGAMMKHYDQKHYAVVEWRNSLHNAPIDKHMPMLYVANEVLQNSKRNRGNKFLEAFSPVLGQSLIFIVQQDRGKIEKVRRTVKIWGDRQVFSMRFITELLRGLDPYRAGGPGGSSSNSSAVASSNSNNNTSSSIHNDNAPQLNYHNHRIHTANAAASTINNNAATTATATTTGTAPTPPLSSPHSPAQQSVNESKSPAATDEKKEDKEEEEEEDPMDILKDRDEEDDDDDDDDVFGSAERILDVDITTLDAKGTAAAGATTPKTTMKRRRSSTGSTGSASKKGRNRRSIISTNALVDIWKQVAELDQNYESSQGKSKKIMDWIQTPEANTLDSLVGEELLEMYKRVLKYQEDLMTERKALHRVATERKNLEMEVMRYLPWLESAIQQDQEDVKFCMSLQKQLKSFQHVHESIRDARDKRVKEEIQHRKEQEERERKKRDEEEQKKFRELALKSETEARQGMVWNPNTREYQYLNTDESWRD